MTSRLRPTLEFTFDAEPSAPRAARRAADRHFSGHPCHEILLLCLSEVVTNAILHAGSGGSVTITETDTSVRVEVADRSAAPPRPRRAGQASPTGRGLQLLDTLSTTWGVHTDSDGTTRDGVAGGDGGRGGGKVVWFEIGAPH
jgi:anti-sigma regulatory factor (Ser/Thr protein kinase)